ncbi:MAG: glycosyltransferase family 39 protein [Planctomycetaceae bacterium]|nr:glycosyltransferase family 39 protein [Planctomycetaceae bacterium]
MFHSAYKADTIELQGIAKEWVWSTPKHPMMSAWILEICNILTHRAFAAPFIASAFCTIVMLTCIWQLARNVLPKKSALIATFAMLPYLPFTLKSFLYNPNTALMLFWTLTIFTFYYALQTNKKRWWIVAGLSLGLGLHAKYTIVLLAIALLFYSLWFPKFRRYWKGVGPWLTVLIAFAVFMPHLLWLYRMDALTLRYVAEALDKKPIAGSGWDHVVCPIVFLLGELGLLIVSPILLLVPSLGWRWKRRTAENETERETLNYLLCCIGIPFLLLAVAFGIKEIVRTTYGFPLWFFLGVYLLLQFQRREENVSFVRTMRWTSLAVSVFVVVFVVQAVYAPYITKKPSHYHYPMYELGTECDRIWDDRFDVPCCYVTGEGFFDGGTAAHAMRDRPSFHFYYFGNMSSPDAIPMGEWSTDEDVNQKGGIVLWEESSGSTVPDWVHRRFPKAEVLPEPLVLPYKTGADIPPLRIGIAIVPPPGILP